MQERIFSCRSLGAYNSLTDRHLAGYFNNVRVRKHLQKVGLISRSGRIVPEKEHRYRLLQRAQQKHVRECLAQAVFYRVLEMERLHQTEIRRRLEDHARRERVHKIKVERSNRYEEEALMILSPRPPTGPRNPRTRHSGPEPDVSDSTDSLNSSRPNTAPGKMQRPVRLKPLNSNSSTTSTKPQNSAQYRNQGPDHAHLLLNSALDRDVLKHFTLTDFTSAASPYRLPVTNNFVTPVPPLNRNKDRGQKGNGALRGRRLRPTTTPNDPAETRDGAVQRVASRSAVSVRMVYLGKSVHLSHDLMEVRDEVKVFQQHCGGENLCVYKGRLREGESFQFVSRRHSGFPFSLTFYLNGLQVERLSSCCEFKHRRSSRLGGRHAHFGFSGVEGAAPCYRCIIALGLDKKPSPPKQVKEDPLAPGSQSNWREAPSDSKPEPGSSQGTPGDPKPKNDYEKDFEADDEGVTHDGADEDNQTSPSPSREEHQENRDHEMKQNPDWDSDPQHSEVRRSSSISSSLSSSSSSDEEEKDEEQKTRVTEESRGSVEKRLMENPPQDLNETMQGHDDETEDVGDGGDDDEKYDEQKEAKSVQEKLVEVILNTLEASSEPELSDSTTEDEEQTSVRKQQHTEEEGDAAQTAEASREISSEKNQPEREETTDGRQSSEKLKQETHGTQEPEIKTEKTEEDGKQEVEEPVEEQTEEEAKERDEAKGELENTDTESPGTEINKNIVNTEEPEATAEDEEMDLKERAEHRPEEQFKSSGLNINQDVKMDDPEEPEEDMVNMTDGESPSATTVTVKVETEEEEAEECLAETNNPEEIQDSAREGNTDLKEAEDTPKDLEVKDPAVSLNTKDEDKEDKNEKVGSEHDEDGRLETEIKEGSETPVEDQVPEAKDKEERENKTKPENLDNEETVDGTNQPDHESTSETFLENIEDDNTDKEEPTAEPTAENQLEHENMSANKDEIRKKDSDPPEEPEVDKEVYQEQITEAGGDEVKIQGELLNDETEKISGEEQNEDSNPVLQETMASGAGETSETDPHNGDGIINAHQEDVNKEEKEEKSEEETEDTEQQENEDVPDEQQKDTTPNMKLEKDLSSVEEVQDEQNSGEQVINDEDVEEHQNNEKQETDHNRQLQQETVDEDGQGDQKEEATQSPEIKQDTSSEEHGVQGQEHKEDPEREVNQAATENTTIVEDLQEDQNAGKPDIENYSDQNTETQDTFMNEEPEQDEGNAGDNENDEEIIQKLEIHQEMVDHDVKDKQEDHEKQEDTDDIMKVEQYQTNEEALQDEQEGEAHENQTEINQEIINPEERNEMHLNSFNKDDQIDGDHQNKVEGKEDHQSFEVPQDDQNIGEQSKMAESEPPEVESKAGTSELNVEDVGTPGEDLVRFSTITEIIRVNDAEETRSASEEGSTSVSKESQLAVREPPSEIEEDEPGVRESAELIVAPQADHGDLVSNWVNVHQAAKYFETFVEPLEDIKGLAEDGTINTEALETRDVGENEDAATLKINHEELKDTAVERLQTQTEAPEQQSKNNQSVTSIRKISEEQERSSEAEERQDLIIENVISATPTPVVTFQISQDS
ncbi:glutamate-rich protein 3 [Trichomycterus rosablanca]|uniref:glutamate-rich protein 3 n=1 Tax=Trichomycterus rosablanca TaxID=2290929 RepID=UPI002F35E53A